MQELNALMGQDSYNDPVLQGHPMRDQNLDHKANVRDVILQGITRKHTSRSCQQIMIISNDHDTRVFFRNILEADGHFVLSSGSAADALALLEKITLPSVILVKNDLMFMSAEQVVKVLKENEKFCSIPVIQITSNNDQMIPGLQNIDSSNDPFKIVTRIFSLKENLQLS